MREIVTGFFEADGWPIEEVSTDTLVATGFAGDTDQWRCFALLQPELNRLMFYSLVPENVPEAQHRLAMEYITRANYGLAIGNFEMDLSDGEVRYKTSVDVEGGELTQGLVQAAVYANVVTMDRYLPGLRRVLAESASPAEAIEQIEAES